MQNIRELLPYIKQEIADIISFQKNNPLTRIEFSVNEIFKVEHEVVNIIMKSGRDFYDFVNEAELSPQEFVNLINSKLKLYTIDAQNKKERDSIVNNPYTIHDIASELYLDLYFKTLKKKKDVSYSKQDFRLITVENHINCFEAINRDLAGFIYYYDANNQNAITITALVDYFASQAHSINMTLKEGFQAQSMSLLRIQLELCATILTLFKSSDETVTKYREFSRFTHLILDHPGLTDADREELESTLQFEMKIADVNQNDRRNFAYYGWMRYNKHINRYGISQMIEYAGLEGFKPFYAESSKFIHVNNYSLSRDMLNLHFRTTYVSMSLLEILCIEYFIYIKAKHPQFLEKIDFAHYNTCFDNLRKVITLENEKIK